MPINIRIVSTYPPRRCGIGTFSRDLANALEHFTAEIGHIRIAAIDRQNGPYHIPVDVVIDQYNPKSWQTAAKEIVGRAIESPHPTVVLLQHEYGLDPGENGEECRGWNYVNLARVLEERNITTLVYLHTVLDQPDEHQRKVIQQLGRHTDGLIVTTESAIEILESSRYHVDHGKLKHIDHGIRMQHPSQFDRLEIKKEFGLADTCLVTTLGLLSPGKGLPYGIRAYGRFIRESCTDEQRRQMLYLVAGQPHPDFVKQESGRPYGQFMADIDLAIAESGMRSARVEDVRKIDPRQTDIAFLDTFLDEGMLLKLYAATNMMVLPYLNMEQMSSGILADTLGSGRVAIATKFRYARELINSNRECPPGLVIGRYARGLLVDPGEPSVEQIAMGLDFLVFHTPKRLKMERQAHQRGHQMRWDNSAWALIQHIEFILDEKETVSGRGPRFQREKPSIYERKSKREIVEA